MSDGQAIEAIRTILNRMDDPAWTVPQVQTFLAALRAEGYEIYRPDECQSVLVEKFNEDRGIVIEKTVPEPPGRYRLVPVGGEG